MSIYDPAEDQEVIRGLRSQNAALTRQLNDAMARSERDHFKDADRFAVLIAENAALRAQSGEPLCRDHGNQANGGACPVHGGDACLVTPGGFANLLREAVERAERAEKQLAEANERHDEIRALCAEAGVHHPRVILTRLAKVVEALEQCVYKRRGDQPGMAQMRDANVMDEDAGAYIRRADAAARSALAAAKKGETE